MFNSIPLSVATGDDATETTTVVFVYIGCPTGIYTLLKIIEFCISRMTHGVVRVSDSERTDEASVFVTMFIFHFYFLVTLFSDKNTLKLI